MLLIEPLHLFTAAYPRYTYSTKLLIFPHLRYRIHENATESKLLVRRDALPSLSSHEEEVAKAKAEPPGWYLWLSSSSMSSWNEGKNCKIRSLWAAVLIIPFQYLVNPVFQIRSVVFQYSPAAKGSWIFERSILLLSSLNTYIGAPRSL